jgi:hypothetical protein
LRFGAKAQLRTSDNSFHRLTYMPQELAGQPAIIRTERGLAMPSPVGDATRSLLPRRGTARGTQVYASLYFHDFTDRRNPSEGF